MTNQPTPPGPPPVPSAPRGRPAPVRPAELAGRDATRVLAVLGKPDRKKRGDLWLSPDRGDSQRVRRTADGKLERLAVFGPVPNTIPAGEPYEEWLYRNFDGNTWHVYLTLQAAAPDGQRQPLRVAEVQVFPVGCVS